jgi:hypothetical protein
MNRVFQLVSNSTIYVTGTYIMDSFNVGSNTFIVSGTTTGVPTASIAWIATPVGTPKGIFSITNGSLTIRFELFLHCQIFFFSYLTLWHNNASKASFISVTAPGKCSLQHVIVKGSESSSALSGCSFSFASLGNGMNHSIYVIFASIYWHDL